MVPPLIFFFFFFNDTATTEIYTLSLHDALPIWVVVAKSHQGQQLSMRIVGELLTFAKNKNIFATTRADERIMSFASDYGFEINGKPYPSGRGYDLVLYLHNAY